jgi:hypothetical protein
VGGGADIMVEYLTISVSLLLFIFSTIKIQRLWLVISLCEVLPLKPLLLKMFSKPQKQDSEKRLLKVE